MRLSIETSQDDGPRSSTREPIQFLSDTPTTLFLCGQI